MSAKQKAGPEHRASDGILLFTVADHFAIEGRGCVVVPGVPDPSPTIPILRRCAPITLRRPDGSADQSIISGLEMLHPRPSVPFTPILLPSPLTKSDVPIGTEVWYFPAADDTYAKARNT